MVDYNYIGASGLVECPECFGVVRGISMEEHLAWHNPNEAASVAI